MDIPRIYTAIAEWSATLVFVCLLIRKYDKKKTALIAGVFLIIQIVFLELTKNVDIIFWIPCMIVAVVLMYAFIYVTCNISFLDAGYYCIRAFVAAEFVASLHWQVYYALISGKANLTISVISMFIVYALIFGFLFRIEKAHALENHQVKITKREFVTVFILGVSIFAVSNLSFVPSGNPKEFDFNIFNIRTLVDLGGVATLFAYHIQLSEKRVREENSAIQNILLKQYEQYQMSKDRVEALNIRYHDFKHQLIALRNEMDEAKRSEYIDKLEADIDRYNELNKTGNPTVDVLLNNKRLLCEKENITFTTVIDGQLLNNMAVMDICTIFGNALDNAIECERKVEDKDKRIINISVSKYKNFVMFAVENYYDQNIVFDEELPITTKDNVDLHGYGLKSIKYTVEKYDGMLDVKHQNNWFELKILIPLNNIN